MVEKGNEQGPAVQNAITAAVDRVAGRNGGLGAMGYFYELARGLHTRRVEELLKAKAGGKKVIGSYCAFVPEELVLAAGAVPVRLDSGFQGSIAAAEEILPRNFCPSIKSSVGLAMGGSPLFDAADVVITPMTCDGKKKMGEVVSRRKPVWSIEVPHTTETPQARELWLKELRLLAAQLERLTGNKITAKSLARAVETMNAKRAAIRQVYEARRSAGVPIFGRDVLLATSMSFMDDPARWTEKVLELASELKSAKAVAPTSAPRIMLTGCPLVLPSWKIPEVIEDSGGIIVADEVCTGQKSLWDPVEVEGSSREDMLVAIADRYLMNNCAVFTPNLARVERLLQFARDFRVEGVVYGILQACHPYGMEADRIEKALEKAGVPTLRIETDYSEEDIEQIRTRVEAFLEMISASRKK